MPSSRRCSAPKSHKTWRCETGENAFVLFLPTYKYSGSALIFVRFLGLGHTPLARHIILTLCLATHSKGRFLLTWILSPGSYIHGRKVVQKYDERSLVSYHMYCLWHVRASVPPSVFPTHCRWGCFPNKSSTSAPSWRRTEEKHSTSTSESNRAGVSDLISFESKIKVTCIILLITFMYIAYRHEPNQMNKLV